MHTLHVNQHVRSSPLVKHTAGALIEVHQNAAHLATWWLHEGVTMARRKADAPIDLTRPHGLTVGFISALRCPEGKEQAFLRDAVTKGLRVRVTAAGAKSFVFESKVLGKTLRRTIGNPDAWTIEAARTEANRLRVLVDQKTDPRDLERQRVKAAERLNDELQTQAETVALAQAAQALTVSKAWARYIAERRPHWGERNYADHLSMTQEGGEARKRLSGVLTKPGPLAPIMAMRLVDLDAKAIEAWAIEEAKHRPARVRLALRLLKAFLRWATAESDLSDKVDPAAANAKKAREAAGKAKPKDDVLERGQLSAWFGAVRVIPNAITAAYLQTLLMTGARPGEVLSLRWDDINTQWMSLTIRDKVEGQRQIPLTPYVWRLLSALSHRNEWVFSSARAISLDVRHVRRRERYHAARGTAAPVGDAAQVSKSGRLMDPDTAHRQACIAANLDGLTLHGLRRSFASLTEWLEVPAGVVAQIQGHKPSATAEKHYKRRPLDLLRVHHERIEAWVLEQAGLPFAAKAAQTAGLRVVA
jgi:integrase